MNYDVVTVFLAFLDTTCLLRVRRVCRLWRPAVVPLLVHRCRWTTTTTLWAQSFWLRDILACEVLMGPVHTRLLVNDDTPRNHYHPPLPEREGVVHFVVVLLCESWGDSGFIEPWLDTLSHGCAIIEFCIQALQFDGSTHAVMQILAAVHNVRGLTNTHRLVLLAPPTGSANFCQNKTVTMLHPLPLIDVLTVTDVMLQELLYQYTQQNISSKTPQDCTLVITDVDALEALDLNTDYVRVCSVFDHSTPPSTVMHWSLRRPLFCDTTVWTFDDCDSHAQVLRTMSRDILQGLATDRQAYTEATARLTDGPTSLVMRIGCCSCTTCYPGLVLKTALQHSLLGIAAPFGPTSSFFSGPKSTICVFRGQAVSGYTYQFEFVFSAPAGFSFPEH